MGVAEKGSFLHRPRRSAPLYQCLSRSSRKPILPPLHDDLSRALYKEGKPTGESVREPLTHGALTALHRKKFFSSHSTIVLFFHGDSL